MTVVKRKLNVLGVAISKESRIYPGDTQPFGFQQNHLLNAHQGYTFNNQFQQRLIPNNRFRQNYTPNNQYDPQYPQNIQYQPGYPINNQYQPDKQLHNQYNQQITGYLYPQPQKPFGKYFMCSYIYF